VKRGFVKIYRKLEDNPIWKAEKFTRGQAWVDLILIANHKPGYIIKRGIRVELERGDIGWSEKQLADRWKWSRGKVRRFLIDACSGEFPFLARKTDTKKKNVTSLYKIVNYTAYQGERTPNGHQTDTKQYRNKNEKNEKKIKDKIHTAKKVFAGHAEEENFYWTRKKRKLKGKRLETFNAFWDRFAYKRGKAEAADAWLEIPAMTDRMCETIYQAADIEAKNRPQLIAEGRTPKMAEGWIRGRRWEDENVELAKGLSEDERLRIIQRSRTTS
jgi:hypothetical protein